MKVRAAVADDAERLASMRWDFRSEMNPASEDRERFVARCAEWMRVRLEGGGAWRCWVVEDDAGLVAGQLWLELIEKLPNPGPELEVHGYITNVYVDPGLRGRGAGEALMRAALEFCRVTRVDSVILWPTERSRSLYARHGFESPNDMMELVLDSGRDLH
jgi:GNAT superfamily N-acetyltransferase